MADLVMGAMGSLIPKLHKLLKEEYNLQTGVKEDISCLTQELEVMQALLHKVAQLPWDQLDKQVQLWARQVRETSYDMEDALDTFLMRVEDPDSFGQESLLKHLGEKMTNLFKKSKEGRKISGNVKDIMTHLQELTEQCREYKVNDNVAKLGTTSTVADPCLRPMYNKVKKLVGMDESSDELISLLQSPERGHTFNMKTKVVSIVGVGGLGKTTLARAVYDKLEGDFDCSSFVPVGRNPDLKEVLKHILLVLDKNRQLWLSGVALLDERQLTNELHFFLRNKRYFIVVDDIRDVQSWKKIRLAIDDGNNCGGTIIITTRSFEVAIEANDAVYRLKPLSYYSSRKLLYTRIYGHEGRYVDNQPDEISDKILRECDGIPLAIMIMASLLMGKQRHEWSEVYKTIVFGRKDNKDKGNTTRILSFCYYDMPSHLRTCLLYTSAFPEGYVIPKDSLIWMWIAEGFIYSNSGKRLFEIGEGYFNDLINRSMIEAVQSDYDGSIINGCRVHEIVLDFICFMSCEENLFTLMDNKGTLAHSNVRRLAYHNMTGGQINQVNYLDIPKVRSFIALGCGMEVIPLSSFKLLRVLAIESCRRTDDAPPLNAEHLGHLHHLRFLGLRRTRIHNDISKEIGALRFLQALDLWDTDILDLPSSRRLPERLMCLRVTFDDIKHGVGVPEVALLAQLTSLEELSIAVKWNNITATRLLVKELGRLRELRVLDASSWWNEDEETERDLVESIGHLHKLQHLRIQSYFYVTRTRWRATELVLPCHLRYLAVSGVMFCKLPSCINPWCLPSLSHLDLSLEYVDEKDLKILGGFPELRFLALHTPHDENLAHAVVIAAGAFPKLQYCYNMGPLVLTFLLGAMPCLECFKFDVKLRHLKDFYFGFSHFDSLRYLPSLEKVHAPIILYGAKMEEAEEAEAALRAVVQSHPNHPNLILNRVGTCVDKQILRDKLHHSQGVASDVMPLELLKQITNDVSDDQKLGKGTFGTVYKCNADDDNHDGQDKIEFGIKQAKELQVGPIGSESNPWGWRQRSPT